MADLLVVTNDPGFGDALSRGLSAEGHSTHVARDGKHATRLLDDGLRPRAIILDSSPSSFPSWAPFTRDAVHCRPECPPLLLERRESLESPAGWTRFIDMVRGLVSNEDGDGSL